jgi:hypothetical protein
MADFAIGALSRRAGVNIETIRYDERIRRHAETAAVRWRKEAL